MTPNIPNYQQRQIMLSFAYLAYCGELITTPNPEQTILGYINTAMPQIPPIAAPNAAWSVVWGPAVYTVPGALYQDNLMFVVQNQSDPSQFAIAVRGTNSIAQIDWLLEDFDVRQQMNWPPGAATSNPPGAMMSESTSIDLQILLAMQGTTNNGNMPLLKFLKSQSSNALNLCVTGHSLGGCLSGTLALFLKENQASWDQSGKSIISCITFAGPTAGNSAFAAYSDSLFSGGPYPPNWDSTLGSNFDAVRCNYDVAPQAWIASNLYNGSTSPLLETYGSNLDIGKNFPFEWPILTAFLSYLVPKLSIPDYQQPVNSAAQLQGTYYPGAVTPPLTSSSQITDYLWAFVQQASWQHGNSYPRILGVPALLDSNIIRPS